MLQLNFSNFKKRLTDETLIVETRINFPGINQIKNITMYTIFINKVPYTFTEKQLENSRLSERRKKTAKRIARQGGEFHINFKRSK